MQAHSMRALARWHRLDVSDVCEPVALDIERPHGRLRLHDWGGNGPLVLLLHGGALSGRSWDFVCLSLRRDYRCVALDLRGHGDSDWADCYRLACHVEDVVAVISTLDGGRAHLVGMSFGGVVAALAAQTTPAQYASVALIDVAPGVSFEATKNMRAFFTELADEQSLTSVVARAARASPRAYIPQLEYRFRSLMREFPDGTWRWKVDRRRPTDFAAILQAVQSLAGVVRAAGLPVLLVRGDRSQVLDAQAAERFRVSVPDAQLRIVADAGHNVQEDNPRGLALALQQFWRALPGASSAT